MRDPSSCLMEPKPDKVARWPMANKVCEIPPIGEAYQREFRMVVTTDRGDIVLYNLTEHIEKKPKSTKNETIVTVSLISENKYYPKLARCLCKVKAPKGAS